MSKPRKKAKKTSWSLAEWQKRCAWCTRFIKANEPAYAISISLKPEAFKEFSPGSVQPLLLFSAGKTVAMMVVTEDSPAKKMGKDAIFQLCSEDCAKQLKTALQQEIG